MQDLIVSWLKENYRTLAVGTVVIVVVVLGVLGYMWNKSARKKASSKLLRQGVVSFYSAKQSENPDFSHAISSLKNVMNSQPRSSAASQAALYLGHIFYLRGDYSSSLEYYKKAASSFGPESQFLEIALLDVAYTLETMGSYEEAISIYRETLDLERGVLKDRAIVGIGRCYEQQGKFSEAIQTYSSMLKRFPNSPWAEELRQRLDVLQSNRAKTS